MNNEFEKIMLDWEMALSDLSHAVKMCEESSKRALEALKSVEISKKIDELDKLDNF